MSAKENQRESAEPKKVTSKPENAVTKIKKPRKHPGFLETLPDDPAILENAESCPATPEGLTFGERVQMGPLLKYMGFSLLLTYHFVLWFIPDSFLNVELLNDQVTYGWLVNLAATSLAVGICALIVRRKKHLSDIGALAYGAPILLVLSTLGLQFLTGLIADSLIVPIAFSALAGLAEGCMIILWAEYLTRIKAHFSSINTAFTFGATMLACLTIGLLLPKWLVPVFASLLAGVSCAILIYVQSNTKEQFSQLLPKKATVVASKNLIIVCLIAFATSAACYFLSAIIPWEDLPFKDATFVVGPLIAGAFLAVVATACYYLRNKNLAFQFLPWFLVGTIAAYALFLYGPQMYMAAFSIALTISSMLEISLIVYVGILVWRGYFAPATAFAGCVIAIRLGTCAGNGLAVFYEHFPTGIMPPIPETSLAFLVLIAILLVPMSKREFAILALTSTPTTPSDLSLTCQMIVEEFGLSDREGEILILIAKGNTANNVASKLVISPHTVNTHIRHIYEKIGIHKRSELIEYINMRKGE